MSPDVAVVGAGAIGCSLAYHLSLSGLRVLVVDPTPAGEASCVAAGILTRLHELERRDLALPAALESLRLFPALVERLQEETGIDTLYRRAGALLLDAPGRGPGWEERTLEAARAAGISAQRLGPEGVYELEPGLAPGVRGGVYGPQECSILPAAFTRALAAAAKRRGARFLPARVLGLRSAPGRVLSLRTDQGEFSAGSYALCAGAWSGALARGWGLRVPVAPARGQLLLLRAAPGTVRHVVDAGGGYLVPREGAVLAGTTVERVGFRRGVTAPAMARLARLAAGLFPALGGAEALGRFSGFRPEPADGLPLLGPAPGWSNLWIASGHFRQGIILSPWTGAGVARWIYEGRAPVGLEPFSPGRFSSSRTEETEATASAPAASARS